MTQSVNVIHQSLLGLPELPCGDADRGAPTKLAYARHGVGYDVYKGAVQTTFMFANEAMTDPLGWQSGWLEDGSVWGEYGAARRVVLVGAQAMAAE